MKKWRLNHHGHRRYIQHMVAFSFNLLLQYLQLYCSHLKFYFGLSISSNTLNTLIYSKKSTQNFKPFKCFIKNRKCTDWFNEYTRLITVIGDSFVISFQLKSSLDWATVQYTRIDNKKKIEREIQIGTREEIKGETRKKCQIVSSFHIN